MDLEWIYRMLWSLQSSKHLICCDSDFRVIASCLYIHDTHSILHLHRFLERSSPHSRMRVCSVREAHQKEWPSRCGAEQPSPSNFGMAAALSLSC